MEKGLEVAPALRTDVRVQLVNDDVLRSAQESRDLVPANDEERLQ